MDLPRTLPALTLLIAVDPEKRRPAGGNDKLGKLVRGAALEELTSRGLLHTEGKKNVRPETTGFTGDPVLDGVLAEIRASQRPRNWKYWVRKDAARTRTAQRDALEASGLIAVERRKLLGLFAMDRITLREHRGVKDLRTRAARALTGGTPVSQLDPQDRALGAIAAIGELNTVTSGRERRRQRARIKQLIAASGPAVEALKKALDDDAAAAASAA